jgi:sporulation protein YlmC with PRC-barrel domain
MHEQEIIHTEFSTPFRRVLSASTLAKDSVRNRMNEKVGSIREIMIDVPSGRISYAVLAVGGFLGIGERLFAIPWEALNLDEDNKCFILDVDKARLQNAPGFDKDNWPDMVNPSWANGVLSYWHVLGTIAGTSGSPDTDDLGIGAARQYDCDAAGFSDRKAEESGHEACAVDSAEGASLRQADELGKSRSKSN